MVSLAVCSAAAQAAPRCVVRGHSVPGVRTSKVIKRTGKVVIYRTRLKSEEYEHKSDVWACDRETNRFVFIGEEEENEEYGTEGALSEFQVAGSWLIVDQRSGVISETECEKYQLPGSENTCASASESLLVVNAARGVMGSISSRNLPAGSALLSADGAMAWWSQAPAQGTEKEGVSSLYGCLAGATKRKVVCKPRLVAQGQIPDASVHLVAKTLSWTAAGQQQSSIL
jgi:hypothetical protein